ncbi:MAG: hypothetical protein ACUVXD_12100 [Thermodesulfobacteriota bacterium]
MVRRLKGLQATVCDLAFSPDGRWLAATKAEYGSPASRLYATNP